MKIVDFETFNRMPVGTVFAPYEPCCFEGEIEIKTDEGRQYSSGWIFNGVLSLMPDVEAYDYGEPTKNCMFHYDGSTPDYMDVKMFVIFEEPDIRRMIETLEYALGGCKNKEYERKYL